jgi:hypothetical protein
MKYCKSKHGYFYKVVGDKKTRISMEEYKAGCKKRAMKGGTLRRNGKLEDTDFLGKNRNNIVPKQNFNVEQNSNMGVELQNMNPNNVGKYKPTNSHKPIKLMIQKGTGKTFLFFGYNPETETYHYVCYNNPDASKLDNNLIKCKKLVIHENGSSKIVELFHMEFLNIDIKELIVLCYHFLKIRQKNHGFMNKLYEYLRLFVFEKVLETQFPNSNNHRMYKDMVEEIGKMVMEEGHIIFNQ